MKPGKDKYRKDRCHESSCIQEMETNKTRNEKQRKSSSGDEEKYILAHHKKSTNIFQSFKSYSDFRGNLGQGPMATSPVISPSWYLHIRRSLVEWAHINRVVFYKRPNIVFAGNTRVLVDVIDNDLQCPHFQVVTYSDDASTPLMFLNDSPCCYYVRTMTSSTGLTPWT